jgi:hypothetical protein
MLMMNEVCQAEANRDNHVLLYCDQDEQDAVHLKKSNHDHGPKNVTENVYQNPMKSD